MAGAPTRRGNRQAPGTGRAASRPDGRGESPHSRGCQFDGERETVQQSHGLGDGGAIALAEDKIRHLRTGTGDEEVDRIHLHRQGFEGKEFLARQMEPLAAGDDEARLDGPVQPATDGGGGVLDDLLEVVEDDQAASAGGDGVPELHAGIVLAQGNAERDGYRPECHRGSWLAQIAEVDAARPIAQPTPAIAADETGLASAARSENRDQPDPASSRAASA